MEKKFTVDWFKTYLKKNWFQVTLVALVIFVLFKKDFNFQINLNSPDKIEEQKTAPEKQPVKQQASTKTKAITANTAKGSLANNSVSDYFSVSFGEATNNTMSVDAVGARVKESFFKRFAHVAISERKKYGIPSSIILANAYLQSTSGMEPLAKKGNNFFAIPCKTVWQGASGTYNDACFRHYENAWNSFRDHSVFVTAALVHQLRSLDSRDYKAWANALEKLNYSGRKNLAKELIEIIEQYQLSQLDSQ